MGRPPSGAFLALLSAAVLQGRALPTTCPGTVPVAGYGSVALANAKWELPEVRAKHVEVSTGPDGSVIQPRMGGRTYFSDFCYNMTHRNEWYAIFKLLNKRLSYFVNLAEAGCGCNAVLSLVSMYHNKEPSSCFDHFCDASATCGVSCTEISIQQANTAAWQSSLFEQPPDGQAPPQAHTAGYGGGAGWTGPRDFNASVYGPRSPCIDTLRPFKVSASFPVGKDGTLQHLALQLSQEDPPCELQTTVRASPEAMAGLTAALSSGLTPALGYWGSSDLAFLDGRGPDGRGPCAADTPWTCGHTVQFYNFAIEDLPQPSGAQPGQAAPPTHSSPDAGPIATAGSRKMCIAGWLPDEECVDTFVYKGVGYTGCTPVDFPSPWCSRTPIWSGEARRCSPCNASSASPLAPGQDLVVLSGPSGTAASADGGMPAGSRAKASASGLGDWRSSWARLVVVPTVALPAIAAIGCMARRLVSTRVGTGQARAVSFADALSDIEVPTEDDGE